MKCKTLAEFSLQEHPEAPTNGQIPRHDFAAYIIVGTLPDGMTVAEPTRRGEHFKAASPQTATLGFGRPAPARPGPIDDQQAVRLENVGWRPLIRWVAPGKMSGPI